MTSGVARSFTYCEYLELEASSEQRYEFFNGMVYAMAGGSPDHSRLAANVIQILGTVLAARPCQDSPRTCACAFWRPASRRTQT
ncbi:MAG TPA: Uma2 family endonuclease [Polyangiaceae bacterium]|jgi:hypothetical protein